MPKKAQDITTCLHSANKLSGIKPITMINEALSENTHFRSGAHSISWVCSGLSKYKFDDA